MIRAGVPDERREISRAVQFPKQESDGNTIKLEGRKEVVDKIAAAILETVAQRESQVTEVVDVPTSQHRVLIGRGGDARRGLESQFRVTIDIPRQGDGKTGVKVSGQPEDVKSAVAHIQTLLQEQQGETMQVPRALHHTISNKGQLFKTLRQNFQVTVDHAGQTPPPKPSGSAAPAPADTGALPLITDDASPDSHSWTVASSNGSSAESGEIAWVLRGSTEGVARARKAIESALEQASKQDTTGYLVLPDPRTYRFVIGQGGRTVNSIRRQSGCKIDVPRDQAPGEAIEITGSSQGVEMAKNLILAAVREGQSG